MLVSGGKTLLGQQAAGQKKSKSRDNDAQSFQDLLGGAQKKKAAPKKKVQKKAMSAPKKKMQNNDGVDDNQYVQKRRENPVKKKLEGQRQPSQTKVVSQQQQETKVQKLAKQEVVNKQEVIDQNNIVDKKFAGAQAKGMEVDASLMSSASQNKTLGKNEKLMQAMENSFEEVMSQVKGQAQANQGTIAMAANGGNKLTGEQVNNLINQNGRKKIDTSMKLSDGMQTLNTESGLQVNGLQNTESSERELGARDESSANMETMFNQMLETEVQTEGVDNSQFAQELTIAQEAGKGEKIENMQSIIKQARAVIDDGGGTMEIHLQPEGLGKVHLKVAVNEGQVNVEMMTDNPAAKKALEEGLFDIKNALEGQKLLVETLKVEMAQDYQKDFSDLQQHMQEQANRDFAEQFLGQFRQEREEKFGGMFDAFRNFQRGPAEPELSLSRNPYMEAGKGRSINLVA